MIFRSPIFTPSTVDILFTGVYEKLSVNNFFDVINWIRSSSNKKTSENYYQYI